MPDYTQAKIYKITDKNNLTYYGSTVQLLRKRRDKHKLPKNECMTMIMDVESIKIELVEEYPCSNSTELHKREQYYIDNFECINKCKAYGRKTSTEYSRISRANRTPEKILKDNEKARIKYLTRDMSKYAELVECECGISCRVDSLRKHKMTKKHITLIERITNKKK
tara:strand:- start:1510 stop:2010 length:501 start_codon:yes stop_codon:yes gene_type:complete